MIFTDEIFTGPNPTEAVVEIFWLNPSPADAVVELFTVTNPHRRRAKDPY